MTRKKIKREGHFANWCKNVFKFKENVRKFPFQRNFSIDIQQKLSLAQFLWKARASIKDLSQQPLTLLFTLKLLSFKNSSMGVKVLWRTIGLNNLESGWYWTVSLWDMCWKSNKPHFSSCVTVFKLGVDFRAQVFTVGSAGPFMSVQ